MSTDAATAPLAAAGEVLRAHPLIGAVEVDPAGGLRLRPDPEALAAVPEPGALVSEFLDHWSEVYDWTYGQGRGRHALDLDLSGWRATDTGEPFPAAHMAEWVQRTADLVLRARPRLLLEVGSGTGMLLHRLHPHLRGYVGLDPSEVAVTALRAAGLPGTAIVRAAAHELRGAPVRAALEGLGAPPDCVLLNSVTQCFPSVAYLRAVLHAAIELVAPGGTVVVGDVRHAGLLDAYCRWAERAADPSVAEPELTARARRRAAREEELLVDPAVLAAVAQAAPRPVALAVHARTLRADTELTRYRFDAVLHVDAAGPAAAVAALDWARLPGAPATADRLGALRQAVREAAPAAPVRIVGIPNRLLGAEEGLTPFALSQAVAGGDAAVLLDPADPALLQVVAPAAAAPVPAAALAGPGRAHEPLPSFARRRLLEVARRTLRRAAPEAAALPLTVDLGPAPTHPERAADAAGRAAVAGVDPGEMPGAMRRMDEVALLAMAATLRAQAGLPGGARRTAGEVAAALGAAPRHAWIVRRWLAVLAEEGWLTRDEDGHFHDLRPVSPAQLAAATPTLDDARHALGYPPELTRFFRAAIDRLPQLLRDEVPLQALLFPDGEVTTALGTYQDNVINRYLNAAVAEVLGGTAAGRPAPLRVVELGAGVGGTTATVLAALAGHDVDYLFTDVSRFFLDAARERFGDHPGLRYGLVDINGELPGQGLAAGGTDVVLAANVAHNAHHVRRMLHGLRAVLAPGGRLALIESCREHYQALTSMHFLMSPRPGQPHPGRDDVRTGTDRIFLTRREWLAELHAAGFTQVLDLPRPEDPLAALAQHLFVVANDRKAPV